MLNVLYKYMMVFTQRIFDAKFKFSNFMVYILKLGKSVISWLCLKLYLLKWPWKLSDPTCNPYQSEVTCHYL